MDNVKNSDPFADGEEFQLRLRVLPGDVPGVCRARRALKSLLRAFGLRVVGIGGPEGNPLPPLPEDLNPQRGEPPF